MVLLWPELLAIQALEEVQLEGLKRDILREICQGNQKGDQEQPVAKVARELQQASSKMVCSVEWLEDKGLLQFRGKIYVSQNADLRRWVVSLYHDTKITGYLGVTLQVNFPWKITFDIFYTNRFSIRIHSGTLSISSEYNTIQWIHWADDNQPRAHIETLRSN